MRYRTYRTYRTHRTYDYRVDEKGQVVKDKDIFFLSRRDGGTRRPPDLGSNCV